jgi:PTS system N-acetylglucosamine-specific IIC component
MEECRMTISVFDGVQRLGRALMLPIAVLPVAGLLLRLGQPDLLDIGFIAAAGNAIFANLALIFAIGVAVGFARDNNGVAGLAGAVGYLVLTAVLKQLDEKIDMGVLAGILTGLVAGGLYNRYHAIKLPEYLAFFGGRRFVPIATGVAGLVLGGLFWLVWPPIQDAIDHAGHWLIGSGVVGVFAYGVLNRILIITGLHHILNNLVWFVFGDYTNAQGVLVHGDLNRYFAGDPSAGIFMAGMFPVMMFGLPAACLAMYRCATPERRKQAGGILLSMALTAFLTGVTEPIEFAFMFLAPMLYALHALLTGVAMALMYLLDVHLGFTFSGGAIDYALGYGVSTNGWMLLPIGLAYFALYYGVFSYCIRRFDLKTPGRDEAENTASSTTDNDSDRALAFISALGGASNLQRVDACATRLRLSLVAREKADDAALKHLGAHGIVRPGQGGSLQVVLGPQADLIAGEIRNALERVGHTAPLAQEPLPETTPLALSDQQVAQWQHALGGAENLRRVEAIAFTRLRLQLDDASRVDRTELEHLGCGGIVPLANGVWHLLVGPQAVGLAAKLSR